MNRPRKILAENSRPTRPNAESTDTPIERSSMVVNSSLFIGPSHLATEADSMARPRPERFKSQWAELRAATDWYLDSCQARGIDREEAIESWEARSIPARIRLFKTSLRAGDERAVLARSNQLSRELRAEANAEAALAIVPGPHSGIEPPAPTRGDDVDDERGADEEPEPFCECTGPMPAPTVADPRRDTKTTSHTG
jgi:hypothetical protein